MELVGEVKGVFTPPMLTGTVIPLGAGLLVSDWAGDRIRKYVEKVPVINMIADPASEMAIGAGLVAASTFVPGGWKPAVKWAGVGGVALGMGHLVGEIVSRLRGSSHSSPSPRPQGQTPQRRPGYY